MVGLSTHDGVVASGSFLPSDHSEGMRDTLYSHRGIRYAKGRPKVLQANTRQAHCDRHEIMWVIRSPEAMVIAARGTCPDAAQDELM